MVLMTIGFRWLASNWIRAKQVWTWHSKHKSVLMIFTPSSNSYRHKMGWNTFWRSVIFIHLLQLVSLIVVWLLHINGDFSWTKYLNSRKHFWWFLEDILSTRIHPFHCEPQSSMALKYLTFVNFGFSKKFLAKIHLGASYFHILCLKGLEIVIKYVIWLHKSSLKHPFF